MIRYQNLILITTYLNENNDKLKVKLEDMIYTINLFKNELEIDVSKRSNKIYQLFGSNRYEDAGKEAQRLFDELKTSQKIIEKIKKSII